MNVCIMTDLEGVAGVINAPDWIYPTSTYYELAKRLLTEEVNAAVDGLCAAGADLIVVQDGHGHGAIDSLLLDERALLQRGWNGPYPFGLDEESFDCIIWIGQHAKSGTPFAHIAHTGSFSVLELTINGIAVGEFGECAFCALEHGCVPIFGSGDLAFSKEAQELMPGIETVWVKRGVIPGSGDECTREEYEHRNAGAIHQHHNVACRKIRGGAYAALMRFRTNPESFCHTMPQPPYELTAKYRASKDGPAQVITRTHPETVTGLMNAYAGR